MAMLPSSNCTQCGQEDFLLIHQAISHRRQVSRLCASCVLRLNPHSFCPICFDVYPPFPSPDAAITCFQCYSVSHLRCLPTLSSPSPTGPYFGPTGPCLGPYLGPIGPYFCPTGPYFCPTCRSNPHSSPISKLDKDSAKKLVAAAKIAYASMKKAAVEAKEEAEKRAAVAAIARQRAKLALEHIANLVAWQRRLDFGEENQDDNDDDASTDDNNSEENDGDDEESDNSSSGGDGESGDDDDDDGSWIQKMNQKLQHNDDIIHINSE